MALGNALHRLLAVPTDQQGQVLRSGQAEQTQRLEVGTRNRLGGALQSETESFVETQRPERQHPLPPNHFQRASRVNLDQAQRMITSCCSQ